MFDEELAEPFARRLADDRAAIDIAHGPGRCDGRGGRDRVARFIGDDQRGYRQAADEVLQFLSGVRFTRNIDFGVGNAEFFQTQTRQVLIAADSFASIHE